MKISFICVLKIILLFMQNTKDLSESTIIVCGIVRDCGKNLKKNIRTINHICSIAKNCHAVIFENDSKDNTKEVLTNWATERKNIHILSNNFNSTTIPPKNSQVNPYFSKHRIEKMALYRNFYLDYIEKENLEGDFVIIVDLDVRKIDSKGIINSFSLNYEWDALAANGISRAPSSFFRKRFFDSYALIECGKENIAQTEQSIKEAQYKWAFLKQNMPLIRVASAFGGLTIYKREAIKNCRYGVLLNDDKKVECRAEHFFFHNQMKTKGYDKIYINPSMRVIYQTQVRKIIDMLLKMIKLKQ